ncbi:MAG: hypothetical protein AAFY71_22010 [Bacteroidota bacterium]
MALLSKLWTLPILSFILISCLKPAESEKKSHPEESLPSQSQLSFWERNDLLIEDFNGDQIADTASRIIQDGKKGNKLKHGGLEEYFIFGAGVTFGFGGDDFVWMDEWGIARDSVLQEHILSVDGDIKVDAHHTFKLKSPGIRVGQSEGSAAVIAYVSSLSKGKVYRWIHQGD